MTSILAAHLLGDFLLQNDWQTSRKTKSSVVCLVHSSIYGLAMFIPVLEGELSLVGWVLIVAEHYAQDRNSLSLRWIKLFRQTPPEKWPVGPLCVDQSMHLAWVWLISKFFKARKP
jgi:hypothetical protein